MRGRGTSVMWRRVREERRRTIMEAGMMGAEMMVVGKKTVEEMAVKGVKGIIVGTIWSRQRPRWMRWC